MIASVICLIIGAICAFIFITLMMIDKIFDIQNKIFSIILAIFGLLCLGAVFGGLITLLIDAIHMI